MTDLRKAAEMALEALMQKGEHHPKVYQAAEALRQALAQHVDAVNISTERVDKTVKREHDRAVELAQAYERGWNAALAQTEQEPVGYINGMHGGYMVFTPINPSAVYLNGTALYTAPPKREWVGLTDEEINDWFFQRLKQAGAGWALDDVVRAVEAKLKEKNGG